MASPDQQREYQRRWMARRREEWFSQQSGCVRCGSQDDLHIDHIDPSTKISHCVWSWSERRRLEELAKCQVLCRICHEEKTAAENRARTGEAAANSKLTQSDVDTIRARVASGETGSRVALDFGVDKGTVSRIVRGKRWPTQVAS